MGLEPDEERSCPQDMSYGVGLSYLSKDLVVHLFGGRNQRIEVTQFRFWLVNFGLERESGQDLTYLPLWSFLNQIGGLDLPPNLDLPTLPELALFGQVRLSQPLLPPTPSDWHNQDLTLPLPQQPQARTSFPPDLDSMTKSLSGPYLTQMDGRVLG